MKATGIVRRMDELGRVVIPKDIRNSCKLEENVPLEIFLETMNDGRTGIVFVPYQVEEKIDWDKIEEAFSDLDADAQHNLLLNLTRIYLDNN